MATQLGWGPEDQGRPLMVNIDGQGWRTAQQASAEAVPGVVGGFRRSLANTARSLGLPLHVQEILQGGDEASFQALNEADVNIGQALGFGAQVAGGGVGAAGLAAGRGLGMAGQFAADVFGSGLVGGMASESGEGVDEFGQSIVQDTAFGTATALASKLLPAAGRVLTAIQGMVPSTRVVQPGDAGEISQGVVQRFQDQGGKLTRAQASGIDADQQLEDAFRSRPRSSGQFAEQDKVNQQLLNRRAAEAVGMPGERFLDDQTLDRAGTGIGQRMGDLVDGVGNMQVDAGVIGKLQQLADEPGLDVATRNGLLGRAKILGENQNDLAPGTYQAIRQKMTREMMDKSQQGKGLDSGVIQEAIEAFDDIPVQSLRAQNRFDEADQFLNNYGDQREQWRNFMALTKGKAVDPNGNVRPVTLANNMRSIFGDTFRLDRKRQLRNQETGALFDTVKGLSNPRMIPNVGNSGTATRLQADMDINRDMQMAGGLTADPAGAALMGLSRIGGEIRPRFREAPQLSGFGRGLGSGVGAGVLDALVEPEQLQEF